jgi:hypothetical protein
VSGVSTLDLRLAESLAKPRFYTTVVLFFGGLLAILGIYSVASFPSRSGSTKSAYGWR